MRVEAIAKSVRISPRKARLAARLVQGMPVERAFNMLGYTDTAAGLRRIGTAPLHSAEEMVKVIKSAAANAEHNFNLDKSTLIVERIEVDPGKIMKRFRPKPRGRAGSIFKRSAHLRAWVSDESGSSEQPSARRSAAAAPKKATAKAPAKAATKKATTKPAAKKADEATAAKEVAEKPKAAPKTTTAKPAAKKPAAPKTDAAKKTAEPKEEKE
jgi:large subunit ribosomal protein L22